MGFLRMTGRIEPDDESHETASAAQEGFHVAGDVYTKNPGQKGYDSAAAANFRKRKERTLECLRETGFHQLADHLEAYIQPNHGKWSYNPPQGIEWLT
jgi:hypothetical protein